MSGRGAPARTETPTPVRAMSAREAAAILPDLISVSITSGCEMATSKLVPFSISRCTTGPETKVKISLWPLVRSNSPDSAVTTGVIPPAQISRISAAEAAPLMSDNASAATAKVLDGMHVLPRCSTVAGLAAIVNQSLTA